MRGHQIVSERDTACNIGRIAIPHNFHLVNQAVFVAKQTSREQLMRVVLLQQQSGGADYRGQN